ncbi:expressed protein [Phakopsora pachyrhizi]|uniref:Expressed protein n=1 Tax=Phakopsora pachyrhizi TaxID=170000 RepID=A0AAV0BLN9_PHAPC|nr:expressed protein [Phakopsora pachyrhizi]
MCAVNYLAHKIMIKLLIILLMLELRAVKAVNLGDVNNFNKGSRIDLSLSLGPPSKRLKLNHSPISSFSTLDPNIRRLDFGGKSNNWGSDLGLSLTRDVIRQALDLELGSNPPIILQIGQAEKLSVTRAIRNGQERQSQVLLEPHSNAHPGRFPCDFPTAYKDLNLFGPQNFNYDSVRESVSRGLKGSGCSDQSNFHLTSRAQNPEFRNGFEIKSNSPNLNQAANYLGIKKKSLPQDPALIKSIYNAVEHEPSTFYRIKPSQKIECVKYFAKDEKFRKGLSHGGQKAKESTINSKTFQENNLSNPKKKTEVEKEMFNENFRQRMVKGKNILEEDTNHFESKRIKGIEIGALKADLSTDTYGSQTFETLKDPYQNVLKIDEERMFLIKAELTKLIKTKKKLNISREKALHNAVANLHDKFEEHQKYFENLKNSWMEEWKAIYKVKKYPTKLIVTTDRIAYNLQFATVYTDQRIVYINEQNNLSFFLDIAQAKNEALKILKACWESIPVAKNLTNKGRLKKPLEIRLLDEDEKISNHKNVLYKYLLNFHLEISQTLSFSASVLKYTLRILLPKIYHSILSIDGTQKNALNFGLIRRLNDVSLVLSDCEAKTIRKVNFHAIK